MRWTAISNKHSGSSTCLKAAILLRLQLRAIDNAWLCGAFSWPIASVACKRQVGNCPSVAMDAISVAPTTARTAAPGVSQLVQKPVRCVVASIASTPDAAIQVQVVGVVCTKLHVVWQWLQDRVGRVPAVHERLHPYGTPAACKSDRSASTPSHADKMYGNHQLVKCQASSLCPT